MPDDLTRERVRDMLEMTVAVHDADCQLPCQCGARERIATRNALHTALLDDPARWCGVVGVVEPQKFPVYDALVTDAIVAWRETGRLIVTPHATVTAGPDIATT